MIRKEKARKEELSGNKGYWYNWWQVYGLGEIGQLQESILPIWDIVSKKPERFKDYIYGLDFGFVHPLALIRIWYFEDELYVEEVIYRSGLTTGPMVNLMQEKGVENHIEIIADPARPEIISELLDCGYVVLKANKNVKIGLDKLKQKTVYVHEDSINIIAENKKYKYKSVSGQQTEEPKKEFDDAIDSIRYGNLYINDFLSHNSSYQAF
jgi:phage terminase large subunit